MDKLSELKELKKLREETIELESLRKTILDYLRSIKCSFLFQNSLFGKIDILKNVIKEESYEEENEENYEGKR